MTQKERELLLLLARETTWRRPEYQACLNLAREIEAEVQPAPDPQAPPAAKSLDEALAGLPVIGALHSVGGPGSGVFAAGPPQKKAASPAAPTPEDNPDLTAAYMAGLERGRDSARTASPSERCACTPAKPQERPATPTPKDTRDTARGVVDRCVGVTGYTERLYLLNCIDSALASERQRTAERVIAFCAARANFYMYHWKSDASDSIGKAISEEARREFGLPAGEKGEVE